MAYNPSSPLTGSAQVNLTSPTYTLAEDQAPEAHAIQHAVTALGGTQTGVVAHSVSAPFTMTFKRPKHLKTLGLPNSAGYYSRVPNNDYTLLTRKAVSVDADNPTRIATVRTIISVPAGSEGYDSPNIRAMLSAHIGALSDTSSGIGGTVVSGIA